MAHWLLIALAAPALWAASNHIDKYLLHQSDQRGIGALMIFSALVGLPMLAIIFVLHPTVLHIAPLHGTLIMLNGMLYILGLLPYFYALERDETSIIIPLYQTTAIFSYLLGLIFLGEELAVQQIGAALLVLVGVVIISLDLERIRFKKDVFWLMMLAALLNALNWFLFKYIAIQEDFWTTSFWEYTGFAVVGLGMLLCVRPYRLNFTLAVRSGGVRMASLVGFNELVGIGAKTATNLASLLAPLALVSTINGLQPLFTLLYGVLLTRYLPRIANEQLGRAVVAQKAMAVAFIIAGTALLSV